MVTTVRLISPPINLPLGPLYSRTISLLVASQAGEAQSVRYMISIKVI